MNYWWSCLLIACTLLSGCAAGPGSRTSISPAPVKVQVLSSPSQKYITYSTPRNSVPIVHRPQARQRPVTRIQNITLLSPRLRGLSSASPVFKSLGASASKANVKQPAAPSGSGETKIAQPLGSKTFGQVSNQQVVAASLLPAMQLNYAGPIVIVIGFVVLICFALSKVAVFVRRAAMTIPVEGSDEFMGEYQPSSPDSSTGVRPRGAETSGGISKGAEGAGRDESHDTELDRSDRQKRILRAQSRSKRNPQAN